MFGFLAKVVDRWAWIVVVCAVVLAGVGGYYGTPVADLMSDDGYRDFNDPAAESIVAEDRIAEAEDANPGADVVALVRVGEDVESSAGRERVEDVAGRIWDDPAVASAVGFYQTRDESFISDDGESTFVIASFDPDTDTERAVERLREEFAGDEEVLLGGEAVVERQVSETVGEDLARAEMLAFPVLFLLSLWIFRGFVAALLPLLVGGVAIMGSFLGLRLVVEEITPLSIYALNLLIGLGLGLSIDYSLFIVSRYREEISRLGPGLEAMRRTLSSAGRTVLFSSLTVALAMASLLVFPQRFLYSMGIGGTFVALLAALVALTMLPAILSILGERVNALSFGRWRRAADEEARDISASPWYRLSRFVMRRPATVAVLTATLLIVVGIPFLGIRFTSIDASVLPEEASSRQVEEALDEEFSGMQEPPITLSVSAPDERSVGEDLEGYAADLGELSNVEEVSQPRFVGDGVWRIDVVPTMDEHSDESLRLVSDVRAMDAPYPVEAGGRSAYFVDQQDSLLERIPYALAIVFASTFVLLFLFTGSVVLPIKAIIMNALTAGATFGIMVWIFQYGNLEGVLDFTSRGALDNTQPIFILAMAFGLSTDYGIFLLSRIKEARDSGADDTEAVAVGVGRTGRIITAAALLFCIAIGAFATSEITLIKELGVGAALAVIIDATIIRALLVPSLMKLLGRFNWYSPRPLRWLYGKIGVSEAPRHSGSR